MRVLLHSSSALVPSAHVQLARFAARTGLRVRRRRHARTLAPLNCPQPAAAEPLIEPSRAGPEAPSGSRCSGDAKLHGADEGYSSGAIPRCQRGMRSNRRALRRMFRSRLGRLHAWHAPWRRPSQRVRASSPAVQRGAQVVWSRRRGSPNPMPPNKAMQLTPMGRRRNRRMSPGLRPGMRLEAPGAQRVHSRKLLWPGGS